MILAVIELYVPDMTLVIRSCYYKYLGAVCTNVNGVGEKIKHEVAKKIVEYFQVNLVYPFVVQVNWITIKTLRDRVAYIGLTESFINALMKSELVEQFKIGALVKFKNIDDAIRADSIFRVVEFPSAAGCGTLPVGEVCVESLCGETKGSLGHVNWNMLTAIPEDEMI